MTSFLPHTRRAPEETGACLPPSTAHQLVQVSVGNRTVEVFVGTGRSELFGKSTQLSQACAHGAGANAHACYPQLLQFWRGRCGWRRENVEWATQIFGQ